MTTYEIRTRMMNCFWSIMMRIEWWIFLGIIIFSFIPIMRRRWRSSKFLLLGNEIIFRAITIFIIIISFSIITWISLGYISSWSAIIFIQSWSTIFAKKFIFSWIFKRRERSTTFFAYFLDKLIILPIFELFLGTKFGFESLEWII